MKTVAIISQKGGCGKTTIATELAAMAAKVGLTVAVIDLDPQASAAQWKDRREADNPAVVSAPSRLRPALDQARAGGADFVVIDTPPRADSQQTEAVRLSDLVIIPVGTGIHDLSTLAATADVVKMGGNTQCAVILNKVQPGAKRGPEEIKETIRASFGLECAPFHLSRLAVYEEAPATGHAASEADPKGRAAKELETLYLWVSGLVNLTEGASHGEERSSSRIAG